MCGADLSDVLTDAEENDCGLLEAVASDSLLASTGADAVSSTSASSTDGYCKIFLQKAGASLVQAVNNKQSILDLHFRVLLIACTCLVRVFKCLAKCSAGTLRIRL